MKFGGTSLADGAGFVRVAELLRSHGMVGGAAPVAVVSAMSGVTDALMNSFRMADDFGVERAALSLEQHLERHLEVAVALGPTAASRMRVLIDCASKEIVGQLGSARTKTAASVDMASRDAIISMGEILAAELLTLVLIESGFPASYVDARRCIKTNDDHGNARALTRVTGLCTRAELQPLLAQKKLPVLGGFIGSTSDGVTTTMGRGSSNHTATLVSAALGARETQIWTDVNGVHTADPSLVPLARTIPCLSYDEAEQLARLGAKVLHEGMFEPVRARQIPIRICNSRAPEAQGTLIGGGRVCGQMPSKRAVKAIAHRNHLVRIDVKSTPAVVANGLQRSIGVILDRHGLPMEIVSRSEQCISLACDESVPLEMITAELQRYGSVETKARQAIVGCVGDGLDGLANRTTLMTEILKAFDSKWEWQPTSECNLVAVVDAGSADALVTRLHEELFEK